MMGTSKLSKNEATAKDILGTVNDLKHRVVGRLAMGTCDEYTGAFLFAVESLDDLLTTFAAIGKVKEDSDK